MTKKTTMYETALEVLETLNAHGYEAYLVGGCVRNKVMGISDIPDYDITTSATPSQTKAIFVKTVDTGIAHGTVTVLLGGYDFEVTTFRTEGTYTDSRRPDAVAFTTNLADDLLRRDFTMNAMAMGKNGDIIDPYGGLNDIGNKIIRAVGAPDERFSEDPLRILRGIRFLAQLGTDFKIEEHTLNAMARQSHKLIHISSERIRIELVKLITGKNVYALEVAYDSGITRYFLPEFDTMMQTLQENPHHCYTVGHHTLHTMHNISNDALLRLVMLLHDVAKPETKTIDDAGIAHFYGHQEQGATVAANILMRLKFVE